MPILRVASALDKSASARATRASLRAPACVARAIVDSSDFGLLMGLLGQQSSPKCEIPCPTPTNHCAKFDAASFILGGEILNRINKQTHTHITKKQ